MKVPKLQDIQPKVATPAGTARPSGQITTVLVNPEEIAHYGEEWQRLGDNAVTPNPFFEPWTLLPALRYLVKDKEKLAFLLVFGPAETGTKPLWGFFPLNIKTSCLGFPVRTLTFWQYRYCALANPLIDAGHVREVLDCFWRWFENNPWNCRILDTNYLLAEGPFHAVWTDFAIGRSALQLNEHPRCLQLAHGSLDSYLSELMSSNHLRDNRRKERRLNEMGAVSYHCAATQAEAERWIEAFLQLEATGWKGGDKGGAFAKQSEDSAYFREVIRMGFASDHVWLMSMCLDEKVIAMKSLFLAGEGSFSYKIAYDEEYWRQSPGLLLELEHLRRLFNDRQVEWSDTCAAPRHPMYESISNRRRMIRRTLFSNNSRWGDVLVSLLPLLRCLKKQLFPRSGEAYLRISTEKPASPAPIKAWLK